MAQLILGPLLRHIGATDATVWVETDTPCEVDILGRRDRTFHVEGHHYAIVSVEGLEPGIYDAELNLVRSVPEEELRAGSGFAAMEQDHPRLAAFNVWQMADIEGVVERLRDRGYRWAQLEAGIRAGRVQIGAFMRGWGAAASTFYDEEVAKLLGTDESPLLMVAVGGR